MKKLESKKMSLKKKYIFMGMVATLVVSIAIYRYIPRDLISLFPVDYSSHMHISHRVVYPIFGRVNDAPYTRPGVNHSEFSFEADTDIFNEIVELLGDYTFHRPLSSIFNNNFSSITTNGSGDDLLIRFFVSDSEVIQIMFRDTRGRNMLLNDRAYSIGLWGDNDVSDLFSQILATINY